MCISHLPKRRLLENIGNGKYFWDLNLEFPLLLCGVGFFFLHSFPVQHLLPTVCFRSARTISACKNTACPILLLLQMYSAHFNTFDIFLHLNFLQNFSVSEAASLTIPPNWMRCQSRYVIIPFRDYVTSHAQSANIWQPL